MIARIIEWSIRWRILVISMTLGIAVVGVYAALITLLREQLAQRIYFATDLYDTVYPHVLFSNLRVEHFVFERQKRSWVLRQHVPELHPRFLGAEEQVVI